MNQTKHLRWKQIRWILLGCVPLFFFLRGIHLILTGGGWIATTDQPTHWVLLYIELIIDAFAVFCCFYVFYKGSYDSDKRFNRRKILIIAITILIIFTFVIHLIRVGIWIQNSV